MRNYTIRYRDGIGRWSTGHIYATGLMNAANIADFRFPGWVSLANPWGLTITR